MQDRAVGAEAAPTIFSTLPVEIDGTNCDQIAADLEAACVPGVSIVIVDLTRTTFCDSSAVRMLVQAHLDAAKRGIELDVAVTSKAVLRVFELTGLTTFLRLYPTVGEAIGTWRRSQAKSA
jgi:anti-sigma B factor antagonist